MSSVIGSLRVNLGLDSAKFERGARRVKDAQARMRQQFRAVGAAAAAMGVAVTAAAIKGAQQIDEAAKAARRLDASIGGFRALELAAQEAGVNLSSLTNDIQTMNREISAIGVSGNAERALKAIGLSAKDIEGLDADEKIARIADQVSALGLDAGETTAVLRDLGVRNREMALLILQGGDAIRSARDDIKDYGLEISNFDATRIEQANDAMSRLGLVTQYAGQQLAIAIVPALGRMAEALTNSLREGGALRIVIDGLTQNLDRMSAYVAAAVTLFGARYVKALVAARIATFSLAGALTTLRTALIPTGIGALIVLGGELALQFSRLVRSAGGFGSAMGKLGDVVKAVWTGIIQGAKAIPASLSGVWSTISGHFSLLVSDLIFAWSKFVGAIANSAQTLAGIEVLGLKPFEGFADGLQGAVSNIVQASGDAAGAASDFFGLADASFAEAGGKIEGAFSGVSVAVAALRSDVEGTTAEIEGSTVAVTDLNTALEETGGGGGGGGAAGRAAAAVAGLKTEAQGMQAALKEAAVTAEGFGRDKAQVFVGGIDNASRAFGDFIAGGGRDFKGFVSSILDSFQGMIAEMVALTAGRQLFGSLFSGAFSGLPQIPSYAVGTSFHPGGPARINEQGGEILNLPRGTQVIPHDISREMAARAGQSAAGGLAITVENRSSTPVRGDIEYENGGRSAKLVLADAVGDAMKQKGGGANKHLRSAGVRPGMPGR